MGPLHPLAERDTPEADSLMGVATRLQQLEAQFRETDAGKSQAFSALKLLTLNLAHAQYDFLTGSHGTTAQLLTKNAEYTHFAQELQIPMPSILITDDSIAIHPRKYRGNSPYQNHIVGAEPTTNSHFQTQVDSINVSLQTGMISGKVTHPGQPNIQGATGVLSDTDVGRVALEISKMSTYLAEHHIRSDAEMLPPEWTLPQEVVDTNEVTTYSDVDI